MKENEKYLEAAKDLKKVLAMAISDDERELSDNDALAFKALSNFLTAHTNLLIDMYNQVDFLARHSAFKEDED